MSMFVMAMRDKLVGMGLDVRCCARNDSLEDADLTIVHALFQSPLYKEHIDELRAKSKTLVGMLEVVNHEMVSKFDRFYYYGRRNQSLEEHLAGRLVHIKPPIDARYYDFQRDPPRKRTVLLDHTPFVFPQWKTGDLRDFMRPLWRFFSNRTDFAVSQLEYGDHGMQPRFVRVVPVMPLRDYLRELASYDTFIVTHEESFGHSVVDAAVLGVRVIVPTDIDGPYVPQHLVGTLGLIPVQCADELEAALLAPFSHRPRLDAVCDISDLAVEIYNYARQ